MSPANCWLGLDMLKLHCQRRLLERQGSHLESSARSRMILRLRWRSRCVVIFRALEWTLKPTEVLPADLMDVVATPRERTRTFGGPFYGRLLFSAKEAVYKAVYPLDETFLDHHDVEVSFAEQKAYVRNGRTIDIRFSISSHIVVFAFSSGLTNL